ncbi:MAG TPA: hypothetical protein VMY77_05670 [Chitinophagaceae bacterium]|nr:hypothetical protein [Chitinophagaceae bacterium]
MRSIITLLMLIILLTSHSLIAQSRSWITGVASFATGSASAEKNDKSVPESNFTIDRDLLLKSKNQKTTAWILVGGGTITAVVGSLVAARGMIDFMSLHPDEADNNIGTGGILITTGVTAILGSIPFFIASGKTKRKANLILKNDPVFFNQHDRNITAGIKINL